MANTQLDYSVGLVKEATYGTPVAVTRFFEAEAQMKYDRQMKQSAMFRPSKRVQRLNRNVLSHIEVSGDMAVEANTKGLGYLLEAFMGVNTSTMIASTSPSVYQQVHTLRKTDFPQSYTIQEILPTLGGGSTYPHTFNGCVADSAEFTAKEGDILGLKVSWLGRDMDTSTAAAAASYPTGDGLLTFVHGAIGMAGTLTAPTTTALASLSGAASTNITDITVTIKNQLDKSGYNLGGSGKRSRPQTLTQAAISGKFTAEYTDNTLRDAYINKTALPLVLTFTHDTLLSATPSNTYSVLQIVIPSIRLNGEVPTSNGGKPITQSIDFEAFDDLTAAEPIWIVYRTLDTAV